MDWVHCNHCFYRPGFQPKRDLILTSCGHIFCKCCEHSGQIERCKVCGVQCSAIPLTSQMPQDVRKYFEEPESFLETVVKTMEFQKTQRSRLNEFNKTLWEKYQKLKFAYQKQTQEKDEKIKKLEEENRKLKKEMYGRSFATPKHQTTISPQCGQVSPFMRMLDQENRRPNTPLFVTPTRPASLSHMYRQNSTPPTPMSDSGVSPGSVASQESSHSAASQRSKDSRQRMYRPGLTPPMSQLSLLSVSAKRDRGSRY